MIITCGLLLATFFGVAHPSRVNWESAAAAEKYFQFKIDANRGLYIPYNVTAQTSGLLDYKNNVSALFKGDGSAFMFHYENSEVVYIPPKTSNQIWDSSKESFTDYFEKMPAPKDLFMLGQKSGQHFDAVSLPDDMAAKMAEVLAVLSIDYSAQCAAMSTTVEISKITADDLKSSLQGFEQNVGDSFSESRGDLKWLVGFFQGLGDFFQDLPGGVSFLTKNKIRIDFKKIVNEPSGFHVLIYFIETWAPHFDVGKMLANRLNSQNSFFSLINKLGGEVNYFSFDGSVYIMSEIVSYKSGENSEESLRNSLRHFYGSPRAHDEDLSGKWRSSVQDLLRIIAKYKLTNPFKPLAVLVKDILNKSWIYNGVNMSKVLDRVISTKPPGSENAINSIIELLNKGKGDDD